MANDEHEPTGREPTGREPSKSPMRRILGTLSGVMMLPLFVLAFASAPACMGFGQAALDVVNQCPVAVTALGAPITTSWLGLSYGNAETEGDDGSANWTFPIEGPRGRGSLDVLARERSGRWQFGRMVLTTGGRSIDVVACAAGGTGAIAAITHRELSGTVTTIVGAPGVAQGASCTVTIDPSDGVLNCHVTVACGAMTLYGGGRGGFGHCAVDANLAPLMRDGNPSSVDGDPMLDLHVATNEVVITDQNAQGTWVVTVTTR